MIISGLRRTAASISASGLFDAEAYRRTYLRFSPFRPWPALHYALIGERLGHRPNPFFDPRYYRRELEASGRVSKGSLLCFYAEQGARRDESPSREFEHAWYAWQNPDWVGHPLRHMLELGIAQRRDPSPRISLNRFLSSIPEDPLGPAAALLRLIAEEGELRGPGIAGDLDELVRRQAAFRAGLNFDLIRRGRPQRPNLVFIQSGRGVRPPYLVHERNFDVLRNYYVDPTGDICPDSDHAVFQRGTKVTGIASLLRRAPELLLAYDHVLFLDDDIALTADEIDRFFGAMRRSGAVLAQPLLTADSDCAWPVFKDQAHAGRIVPVSSVEVMMPAFSREALVRLAWTFEETISGFGVDLLWGHALPNERNTCRVVLVGEVQARHEKAIDEVGGAFYRFMAANGINPKFELWKVMRQHGIVPQFGVHTTAGSALA